MIAGFRGGAVVFFGGMTLLDGTRASLSWTYAARNRFHKEEQRGEKNGDLENRDLFIHEQER